MRTYTAKECSCWSTYPNKAYKKENQWKCIDNYKCIKEKEYQRKTKCILIEVDK